MSIAVVRIPRWAGSLTLPVLLVYAACRIVSAVILAADAQNQTPTGWTGPSVDYLTYTAQWDGQWYERIATEGYPRVLPIGADGLVQQNAWAFYPLFPMIVRVVMAVTGGSFYLVGSTVSLVAGFGAAHLIGRLLGPRLGRWGTLATIAVWGSMPAAPVLQVGYTEALAMAVLAAYLLALSREKWLTATTLALVVGVTRPIAVPLGIVTLVAVLARWRARRTRPLARAEVVRALAALAGCGVAGLLWPAIVWIGTGQRDGYTETMASWRSGHHITWLGPWLDMAKYWLGATWGPVVLVAGVLAIVGLHVGPWSARLGAQLRAWGLAYPAYLAFVLDPGTSIIRYLIPLFTVIPALLGVGWRRLGRGRLALSIGLTVLVLIVEICLQQWWVHTLWNFSPPSDWPP